MTSVNILHEMAHIPCPTDSGHNLVEMGHASTTVDGPVNMGGIKLNGQCHHSLRHHPEHGMVKLSSTGSEHNHIVYLDNIKYAGNNGKATSTAHNLNYLMGPHL